MKPQDIVLVKFPFSNQSQAKLRPALILSTKGLAGDIIILAITTQKIGKNLHETLLTNNDLTKGTLPKTSFIRTLKIATIERDIIQKTIGQISHKKWTEVQEKLKKILFS